MIVSCNYYIYNSVYYTMKVLKLMITTIMVNNATFIQGGAPKIAKLVQITPISLWFKGDISILTTVCTNQLITGGHGDHSIMIIIFVANIFIRWVPDSSASMRPSSPSCPAVPCVFFERATFVGFGESHG